MRGTGTTPSGVHIIYPDGINWTKAYCDMSTDRGGWTVRIIVLQRRTDRTTSFDRDWIDYKEGFGDPQKEYWLDENSKYKLTIGDYSGTAGNWMVHNNGRAFSTKDKDNDDYHSNNCAVTRGAWWHGTCSNSYLNGKDNINYFWAGYKYNTTKMMIRKIL
ncbi:unnamed protein product [Mytilus edulis]|uniref:Fibrinogen C-terminal domain-containing protein n=1 Tax=Mytilus edulis TaxID=6550 RepID=A0A8S3SB61_MYTED|nr:unnamed protein product [Mytilus edulis]